MIEPLGYEQREGRDAHYVEYDANVQLQDCIDHEGFRALFAIEAIPDEGVQCEAHQRTIHKCFMQDVRQVVSNLAHSVHFEVVQHPFLLLKDDLTKQLAAEHVESNRQEHLGHHRVHVGFHLHRIYFLLTLAAIVVKGEDICYINIDQTSWYQYIEGDDAQELPY